MSGALPGEIKPMRLAIRGEGSMVNAYLAHPNTMEGAALVASLSRQLAEDHPEVFEDFKLMMSKAVTAVVEKTFNTKALRVEIEAAPEHERAGHA